MSTCLGRQWQRLVWLVLHVLINCHAIERTTGPAITDLEEKRGELQRHPWNDFCHQLTKMEFGRQELRQAMDRSWPALAPSPAHFFPILIDPTPPWILWSCSLVSSCHTISLNLHQSRCVSLPLSNPLKVFIKFLLFAADNQRVKCCSSDGSSVIPPHQAHFACMPIFIDQDDEFYRRFHQRCMNFVRLAIAPDHTCQLGYAKTLSKVSHYIDGSAIYGSDVQTMMDLRSFKNGQLKMFIDFDRALLPLNPKSQDCLVHGSACFMAGDVRVNQHITLVAVHLLFAREHNRIAGLLHRLNPHWSDDIIFEESRKIVVAEIQHITYNEWLPLVIGQEAMQRFSLRSSPHGYSSDYNDEINPSMTNEFTGAAFRFGHSTVQGRLFVEFNRKLDEIVLISDTFNNPGRFRFQHFYDEIMRTLVHEPMQSVDNSVTFGVS